VADLDPSVIQQALTLMGGLGAQALQAVTGYDAAASRFSDASGRFQSAGSVASGAFQGAMNKIGSGAQALAPKIAHLGAAFHSLTSGPIPTAEQAMTAVGQALGAGITSAADKAAQALSKLGPEGAAAGVALEGLAAVSAATVGSLTTLMGTAIEVTERVGMLRASLEGLTGGAAAGAAAGRQIEGLVDALPFARQQTQAWATSLLQVGVAGEQLAAQVRAIAAAQALTAVTGGQGGAAAQSMFTRLAMGGKATEAFMKQVHEGGRVAAKMLAEMGLNIKDLGGETAVAKMNAEQFGDAVTKALQKRGGGALEMMGASFPNILQKAREGLLSLFSGLGPAVEPFMAAVKGLFGEFSKGGVAINLLKPIVTSVFSTMFSWATKAVDAIHRGFLIVAIAALQLYIKLRPTLDRIKEFMTSATFLQGLKVVLVGVAIVAGLIALPFVLAGVAVLLFVAAVGAIAAATVYVIGFVSDAAGALADWAIGAVKSARDFVAGLVEGIESGAGAVVDAVKGLATSALGAFKGAFGIASPSRVMLEHGERNIAGAAATGIDRGADKVDASMSKLGAGGAGAPGGGRGTTITIGQIVMQVGEREDAESFASRFFAELQALAVEAPA
jgi:hypothetical protein